MNKNNMEDPIQLQQKIIYFKAELAKYKEKVKDYQENYHYAHLDNLKEQNIQLMENNAELDYRVERMEKELQAAEEIIAEQQSDRSRMQIRNKSLQELLQKQECEFQVIKENLLAKNEHIQKENEKLQTKLIGLKQAHRELQEKYQKTSKQLANYEEAEQLLRSQIERYHSNEEKINGWEKWKQAKEETIEELTQDNLILKSQVEKLKAKLDNKESI
ncbi:hypothetical protein ACGTN9_09125 [Halobacillus sp. MO56]